MASTVQAGMIFQVVDIPTLPEWQQVVIILAMAVVLALLVRLALEIWIRGSTRLTDTDLDRVVYEEVGPPLYVTILLSGIYLVLPYLAMPRFEYFIGGVILTVILFLWARAGIHLAKRMLEVLRERGKEPEFAPVLKNLWTFVILIGGLFFFLSAWDIDVTPFLAGAGVAGIIIGIAAQDSIGNFFAGISLNLDQTYQVGDVILLEDDTRGTVTNISIRSTTILTRDNIEITVPNNYMNNTQVTNESAPRRRRRIRLNVGVGYDSDLSQVESILVEIARETDVILDDPAPIVRFRDFENSSIRAQLQCYIDHPSQLGRARHELIVAITDAFRNDGIKIPFPQRELTFFEEGNEIRVNRES